MPKTKRRSKKYTRTKRSRNKKSIKKAKRLSRKRMRGGNKECKEASTAAAISHEKIEILGNYKKQNFNNIQELIEQIEFDKHNDNEYGDILYTNFLEHVKFNQALDPLVNVNTVIKNYRKNEKEKYKNLTEREKIKCENKYQHLTTPEGENTPAEYSSLLSLSERKNQQKEANMANRLNRQLNEEEETQNRYQTASTDLLYYEAPYQPAPDFPLSRGSTPRSSPPKALSMKRQSPCPRGKTRDKDGICQDNIYAAWSKNKNVWAKRRTLYKDSKTHLEEEDY